MKLPSVLVSLLITYVCIHADTISAVGYPSSTVDKSQAQTLVHLTDLALRRNTKTRIAWASIRSSEAGLELARAGYWPQIDASLSAQRNRALNFTGQPADNQTRYSASVNLSYLLWDFGTRGGTLEQAKFQLASVQLTHNQIMQDVILQVEQAYYLTLGLEAVVLAVRQNYMDAETNLEAAQYRRTVGLSTIGDVYKAEAALAGARLAMQQVEGQLAATRGTLAVSVGESPDTLISLVAWEPEAAALPEQSVASLLDEALGARPELLAAKAREQESAAKIRAIRGSALPTLSFDASAGHTQVHNIGDSSQFSALFSLKIPLFSGFGDRAAVHLAEAELENVRAVNDELRSQVALQVWRAYQDLRTAATTLDSSDSQLKSAQQAADVSGARYKSGLDTILDVLSAQSTLASARVQKIQARLNWTAARATLGHAVGGLKMPISTKDQM
ncbi:MAG: TolC family protein [Gammaproteobacteria bacterium]|nr:TolC family protein [Gammaproteobacteria bacterium]